MLNVSSLGPFSLASACFLCVFLDVLIAYSTAVFEKKNKVFEPGC